VLQAMLPYFSERFGNPSGRSHVFGQEAHLAVEEARCLVAALVGAEPDEIVFTSGATESDNLAVRGVAAALADTGRHLVTTTLEHAAVLEPCRSLEREGFQITRVPVDERGIVSAADVTAALRPDTVLVSVMAANNEIGTLQPVSEIGAVCRERGILFHSDAVQAVGRVPAAVRDWSVDLMSLSAHKMYGPKGVGAIYVRRRNPRVLLSPLMDGGGHERGMRSGTLNVPGIVGFGMAAEIARLELEEESKRILALRERLRTGLEKNLDELYINGDMEHRIPGNLNISFAFVEGESLLMGIEDIAVSSGSACTSASLEPSYVLKALGVGEDLAHTSIRFGIGRFNTEEEVDYVVDKVTRTVQRLRDLSPLYEMVKDGIDLSTVKWTAE
jgi:cysteine desulfurase